MNYIFIDIFTASSFVFKILFEYSNLHVIMNMIYFPVNYSYKYFHTNHNPSTLKLFSW